MQRGITGAQAFMEQIVHFTKITFILVLVMRLDIILDQTIILNNIHQPVEMDMGI